METYKDLIDFLQTSSDKGTMKFHTARTRKTAIRRVFEDSPYERTSIHELDIPAVMQDFQERLEEDISADTVNTYKSRITQTYKDYIRYVKLGEQQTKSALTSAKTEEQPVQIANTIELPCPIRGGSLIVKVSNLPTDLTEEELDAIIAKIRPYSIKAKT